MCFFHLFLFFFNDTATTEIYTLSLHDALPIWRPEVVPGAWLARRDHGAVACSDRKSTRLNSSHANISYAVFCLKKKTTNFCLVYNKTTRTRNRTRTGNT